MPTYHSPEEVLHIQECYLLLTFIWSILVVILGIYTNHVYGLIVLIFPYLVFGFAYLFARDITTEMEDNLFSGQFFTIAIFITLPLLVRADNVRSSRSQYMIPMLMALTFTILSVIDFWVPEEWLIYERHLQKGFAVMGLTLVVFSLYTFYAEIQRTSSA